MRLPIADEFASLLRLSYQKTIWRCSETGDVSSAFSSIAEISVERDKEIEDNCIYIHPLALFFAILAGIVGSLRSQQDLPQRKPHTMDSETLPKGVGRVEFMRC